MFVCRSFPSMACGDLRNAYNKWRRQESVCPKQSLLEITNTRFSTQQEAEVYLKLRSQGRKALAVRVGEDWLVGGQS